MAMLGKCRVSLLHLRYVKSWRPKPSKVYPEEHTPANSDGRTFEISALRTIRISNLGLDVNEKLCLIDGGSNCGLAGEQMREYEVSTEQVNIIGACFRRYRKWNE